MTGIASKLLAALFLILGATGAHPAAPQDAAGRWALHSGGRALMILDLRTDAAAPGRWAGTLHRPASIQLVGGSAAIGDYRWSRIAGPVEARPLVAATVEGEWLRLVFEGPPGEPVRYAIRALPRGFAEISFDPGGAAPMRFVRAEPGETVATDWVRARTYAADPAWPSNAEIAAMFEVDQAARRSPAQIDWTLLTREDEARRRRARVLLDSGALQSADDFYHAAFIFQHGEQPDDYLLAHSLAMAAVARGRPGASWIAAATLDRYLQNIGRPQIFGTQFSTPPGQPTTQAPYDPALVSDALRSALGVPVRAAQEERRLEIQARYARPQPAPATPPR
ncbi:MAG TPA: hypothetical protein VF552_11140 [Allosphingosinicella sp.]|jgi:hypothetical protein